MIKGLTLHAQTGEADKTVRRLPSSQSQWHRVGWSKLSGVLTWICGQDCATIGWFAMNCYPLQGHEKPNCLIVSSNQFEPVHWILYNGFPGLLWRLLEGSALKHPNEMQLTINRCCLAWSYCSKLLPQDQMWWLFGRLVNPWIGGCSALLVSFWSCSTTTEEDTPREIESSESGNHELKWWNRWHKGGYFMGKYVWSSPWTRLWNLRQPPKIESVVVAVMRSSWTRPFAGCVAD